jgi:hypothetical protein
MLIQRLEIILRNKISPNGLKPQYCFVQSHLIRIRNYAKILNDSTKHIIDLPPRLRPHESSPLYSLGLFISPKFKTQTITRTQGQGGRKTFSWFCDLDISPTGLYRRFSRDESDRRLVDLLLHGHGQFLGQERRLQKTQGEIR